MYKPGYNSGDHEKSRVAQEDSSIKMTTGPKPTKQKGSKGRKKMKY